MINPSEPVTESQVTALRNCIKRRINSYGNKGHKNKKGAVSSQIVLVFFSALTPILLGWKLEKDSWVSATLVNIALISSGITTVCSSLQAFFDWKDLWAGYKTSRNELDGIIAEIDYFVTLGYDKITQQDMSNFFNRYKDVCMRMDASYRSVRTDDNSGTIPPKDSKPKS